VPALIEQLGRSLAGFAYEILISDDDSGDRTWAVAEELARSNPCVRVLRRTTNKGLGWSVIDGFTVASGEILACMDADLQHDPAILPSMVKELESGADLVVGSRYIRGGGTEDWSLWRAAESWAATKLAQQFTGIKIHDPMSGYFAMWRTDFMRVRESLDGSGFKILLEIAAKMPRARIQEVPFIFRKRKAGDSKLTHKVVFAYLSQLCRLSCGRSKQRQPDFDGTQEPTNNQA
jgi:dolichol-phosphate mannosyltransferase